jgi:hypothetical protein
MVDRTHPGQPNLRRNKMRGILLTIVLIFICGIVPAMDKNDIKNMCKAGVEPAIVIKMAQDAKITLTEAEASVFLKDGVPNAVVSILTVKEVPAVVVVAAAPAKKNLIIANVGNLPFYAEVNLDNNDIVLSYTLGKYLIPVNARASLSVPNSNYRVYWNGYDDILDAKVKRGETTSVNIEARTDIIYGSVYRDGEEQDSGYLWKRLPSYSSVVIVDSSPPVVYSPPVYVVREPVYIYRQPAPRTSWFFDLNFGGHDRDRHDSHRDHRR